MNDSSEVAGGIAAPDGRALRIGPFPSSPSAAPAGLAAMGRAGTEGPSRGAVRPMNFILYQPTPIDLLPGRLGESDYSYYFVMRGFRSVLERLGTVHVVEDPEREVDPLYEALSVRGENALFLCFAPPHRCPVDLRCPTTSVLAWEFESIPDEQWGADPRTDWRHVFRRHGRAITLSEQAAKLVRKAMGEDFPVAVIPVPVWDRFATPLDIGDLSPVRDGIDLEIEGIVLDGRQICQSDGALPDLRARAWSGEPIEVDFRAEARSRAVLDGFYESENWGTWSRGAEPSITLPYAVSGPMHVRVEACAFGANIGRPLRMTLGDSEATIVLGQGRGSLDLELHPRAPSSVVRFSNLDLTPIQGFRDSRSMGIGFTSLRIRRADGADRDPVDAPSDTTPTVTRVHLEGVVYTSVLNPLDGRKNWKDLLSAFVWAFRHTPDAVLVLKMTHHDIFAYLNDLRAQLLQLAPFECRIVIIQAFLDDSTYADLVSATTYYVNASRGEGLCIPLMEFMSCGKPGIAPMNTAMLDYLTAENGFPVRSWRMHNAWPPDPRQLYRTTWSRIDWASLLEAYRASYEMARRPPGDYQTMGRKASETMEHFSSDAVVEDKLAAFVRRSLVTR